MEIYNIKQKKIRCAKCGSLLNWHLTRPCPHPIVRAACGENICMSCCNGCKYKVEPKYYSGLGCGYVAELAETENYIQTESKEEQ